MIIDKKRQTKQKIGTTKKNQKAWEVIARLKWINSLSDFNFNCPFDKDDNHALHQTNNNLQNLYIFTPWWLVTTLVWKLYEEDNAFFQFVIAPLPYCKGEMYKSQESYTSVMSFSQMLSINHRTDYISTVST